MCLIFFLLKIYFIEQNHYFKKCLLPGCRDGDCKPLWASGGKRSAEAWFLQILVVKLLSGRTEMI